MTLELVGAAGEAADDVVIVVVGGVIVVDIVVAVVVSDVESTTMPLPPPSSKLCDADEEVLDDFRDFFLAVEEALELLRRLLQRLGGSGEATCSGEYIQNF